MLLSACFFTWRESHATMHSHTMEAFLDNNSYRSQSQWRVINAWRQNRNNPCEGFEISKCNETRNILGFRILSRYMIWQRNFYYPRFVSWVTAHTEPTSWPFSAKAPRPLMIGSEQIVVITGVSHEYKLRKMAHKLAWTFFLLMERLLSFNIRYESTSDKVHSRCCVTSCLPFSGCDEFLLV